MLNGLDDIGLTKEKQTSIDAYEAKAKTARAWATCETHHTAPLVMPERRGMSAVMPAAAPVAGPSRGLLTGKSWSAVFGAIVIVAVLVPVLNLLVPVGSPFHLSEYAVQLIGKIMCYAICALAMDLIWGYTGILSLGHGMFFALGADQFNELYSKDRKEKE
eukprot:gene41723-56493_t